MWVGFAVGDMSQQVNIRLAAKNCGWMLTLCFPSAPPLEKVIIAPALNLSLQGFPRVDNGLNQAEIEFR